MVPLLLLGCGTATPAVPFNLVPVATIEQPTAIAVPRAGPDGLYVVEQAGRIWRVDPEGKGAPALVLDIRERVTAGGEMGLLGLAFAPGYPQDARAFVNYTHTEGEQLRTRIAAFAVSADGATFDPASEVEILGFDQPWSNHNGGPVVAGPDRKLYIGIGDGGSGGDPNGTGQDRSDWLGSILRIDVSPGATPYTVPADNPFVGVSGAAPEVWAYGIRNPWGMHFDGDTLWFADVGQNRWEEVDRGVAGGNYGWNVMEGNHCYKAATCDSKGFVAPVAEYSHELGASVTGGVVYRGPSVPMIDGKYVYADFATGRFWAVSPQGGASTLIGDTDLNPSTFGVDRAGRLYIGDYQGKIWRMEK